MKTIKVVFWTAFAGLVFSASAQTSSLNTVDANDTNLQPDAIDITLPFFTRGDNTLRLMGGFSSRAGSFVGLSDSTDNLLGLGETLHLNAEMGMRLRHIEFGFTEPSLRGKAIQFGFTVYGDRFHFNQVHESSILAFERDISEFSRMDPGDPVDYTLTGYGVKLFVEHPLQHKLARLNLTYTYDISAIRTLTDATTDFFNELDFRGAGQSDGLTGIRTSKLTLSYTYNTIDNPVNPTQGAAFRVSMTTAGLGGNVNMLELDIEAKYFHHGLRAGHVVALHLRGRLLSGYDGRSAPPFDRSYMGGENDVRGFDSWSVGPIGLVPGERSILVLNPDGSRRTVTVVVNGYPTAVLETLPVPGYRLFSMGGDTNVVANFEYRIPIRGPVTLVLFTDAGVNRATFPSQTRVDVDSLSAEFPYSAFTNRVRIEPGTQNIPMSIGPELQVLVPKVKVPVRFYWALNPLAFRETLYLPIVLNPSTFPNAATFDSAYAAMGEATPCKEPRSKFMFSVGRTF